MDYIHPILIVSLKRCSSGSDEDTIPKRQHHEEGLVQVTPHLNPYLPQTSNAHTPVYVMYTNRESPSPPHFSQANRTSVFPLQHQTVSTASMPAFHIVQISAPPSTHQNRIIMSPSCPSLLPNKKLIYDSSSESSDSDSECEQLSPRPTVIQAPPPLISGPPNAGLQSFVAMSNQHQNILVHSNGTQGYLTTSSASHTGGHGNGILQMPTQQFLVPVTALSQIQGNPNLLLQPLIAPSQTNSSIIQLSSYNSSVTPTVSCTAEPGSQPFIRALPFVVSGSKEGKISKQGAPTGSGQTFQLLTLPGGATHQIVDQAH